LVQLAEDRFGIGQAEVVDPASKEAALPKNRKSRKNRVTGCREIV